LKEVFKRLDDAGLKLKTLKCKFFQDKVRYLSHEISKEGLEKPHERIEDINKAPAPSNQAELRSLIGMVNYYGRLIKNLSAIISPLYELMSQSVKWVWSKDCQRTFEIVKKDITSDRNLVHFDNNLPNFFSCNSSEYSIGAMISHVMPDETEKLVAFVSRRLNAAEINYAMLEKMLEHGFCSITFISVPQGYRVCVNYR
jgi:hypothetical protein